MTTTRFMPLDRLTRRAAIAVWLTDAFARDTVRPADARAPRGTVSVRVTGQVIGGSYLPFHARDPNMVIQAVEHQDGMYSLTSQRLTPGTYRVAIETEFYRAVSPMDVSFPSGDPADPTLLVPTPVAGVWSPLALEPLPHYPFPPEATLLRGELCWPDGSGIAGATLRVSSVSLNTATVGHDGRWVLYFPFSQSNATVTVDITYPASGLTSEQQATLPSLPNTVANVAIRRGESVALPQTRLRGRVLTSAGLPVKGAQIAVDGFAMITRSSQDGAYGFQFPLDQPDGSVTVRVRLSGGQEVVHANAAVMNRRTTNAPDTEFTV